MVIVAKNFEHLKNIIKEQIDIHGNQCDLNHIDISKVMHIDSLFVSYPEFNGDISKWNTSHVKTMNTTFQGSKFNGDISNWDTSNVTEMMALFYQSEFNGDISNWDVSKVKEMRYLFLGSSFNGNISKWDVSHVKKMNAMFIKSKFCGDLTNWTPYHADVTAMFDNTSAHIPYWYHANSGLGRKKIITKHLVEIKKIQDFHEQLEAIALEKNSLSHKVKI